jgi:hypothetical protein
MLIYGAIYHPTELSGVTTVRPIMAWVLQLHAIVQVIACSLIGSRNLACDDGVNQDYCEVTTITGEYDMAIITLDRLHSVLSYRLTPPDILSVLYRRHTNSGDTCALPGPHLNWEWALRHFGPRLLVGFWCENTSHVEILDLSSNRCQTSL